MIEHGSAAVTPPDVLHITPTTGNILPRTYICRAAAAVALAGTTLIGGLSEAPAQFTQPVHAAPKNVAPENIELSVPADKALPIRVKDRPTDIEISPVTSNFVFKLLSEPAPDVFKNAEKDIQATANRERRSPFLKHSYAKNLDTDLSQAQYIDSQYQGYKTLADKYHLTLHDPREAKIALNELERSGTGSYEEYLDIARDYLGEFNVELQAATPADQDFLGESVIPATEEQLHSGTSKRALVELVTAFGRLTQEYVDFAAGGHDLTIYLAGNPDPKPDLNDPDKLEDIYAGMAYTNDARRAIALNVEGGVSKPVINHELVHHLDATMSGGEAGIDGEYGILNNGAPYLDEDKNKGLVVDRFNEANNSTLGSVWKEREKSNFAAACEIAKGNEDHLRELGKSVLYITDYAGQRSVTEDKAEVGTSLLGDSYDFAKVTSEDTPHIRQKALVLLRRIATFRPRVAAYIVGAGNLGANPYHSASEDCAEPIDYSGSK